MNRSHHALLNFLLHCGQLEVPQSCRSHENTHFEKCSTSHARALPTALRNVRDQAPGKSSAAIPTAPTIHPSPLDSSWTNCLPPPPPLHSSASRRVEGPRFLNETPGPIPAGFCPQVVDRCSPGVDGAGSSGIGGATAVPEEDSLRSTAEGGLSLENWEDDEGATNKSK